MFFDKRGVAASTGLIIFIALLVGASLAAGVILMVATDLQREGASATQQAEQTSSSKLHILSVVGENGEDGYLENFCEYIKIAPGSAAIRMDSTPIIFETPDNTRTYVAGTEVSGLTVGGAWQSLPAELFDIDNDGNNDDIRLIASFGINDNEHLEVRPSGAVTDFYRFDIGEDLENAGTTPVNMAMYGSELTGTGAVSGVDKTIQASIVGRTSVDESLPRNDVFVAVSKIQNAPTNAGVYAIFNTHDANGQFNHVIRHNHVSKVCFGSEPIGESINVKLRHIPMYAVPTTTEFNTPDVISEQKIDLYPWYEG